MKLTPEQLEKIANRLLEAQDETHPEPPAQFARNVMREITTLRHREERDAEDLFGSLVWRFASASAICALLLFASVARSGLSTEDQLVELLCLPGDAESLIEPGILTVGL